MTISPVTIRAAVFFLFVFFKHRSSLRMSIDLLHICSQDASVQLQVQHPHICSSLFCSLIGGRTANNMVQYTGDLRQTQRKWWQQNHFSWTWRCFPQISWNYSFESRAEPELNTSLIYITPTRAVIQHFQSNWNRWTCTATTNKKHL